MPPGGIIKYGMRRRSPVEKDGREERLGFRFKAIVGSAERLRKLTPARKLDSADDLIRDARSLHDAAKGTLARRRR